MLPFCMRYQADFEVPSVSPKSPLFLTSAIASLRHPPPLSFSAGSSGPRHQAEHCSLLGSTAQSLTTYPPRFR